MNVTIEMLNKMPSGEKACNGARQWFSENWPAADYPGGVEFWVVWDACNNFHWLLWFTEHNLIDLSEFSWKCAGQSFRYASKLLPELAIYADNLTPENWQAAAIAAASAAAHASAAAYAARAEKITWLAELWQGHFNTTDDTD